MGQLLLMGGEFNLRSELFGANEQGAVLDPAITESARTWRRNLLTYSEGDISRFTVKDQVSNAVTSIGGFDSSIYFTDNSILRFCHAVLTTTTGVSHTFSIYVQMDDNSVPVPGSTTTTGDFSLIALSGLQSDVTVTLVSGSLYRLSKTFAGDGTSKNFGIVKYTGQSAKGFRVTGYQVEIGALTAYQRITDFNTEFKAAFPTHTIYQDSNGVAPVTAPGDLVGLVLDQRQGALSNLGPELITNGGFDSWSGDNPTGWTIEGTENATNYVTESSGRARMVSDGSTMGISQTVLTIGKWYVWSADVISVTGTAKFAFGTADTIFTTPGRRSGIVNANGTKFQVRREFACDVIVDNISIREIPGNHAYQTTSGARPTLARVPFGGRRNLLTRTEEFDNAAWLKNNANITANAVTSPSGSMADLCIPTVDNTTHFIRQISLPSNTYTFSCYLKAAGETQVSLWLASASVAGIFTLTGSGSYTGAGGLSAASIEHVGDGWYLCQVWHNVAGTTVHIYGRSGSAYIGNGTDGFYIADAQAEATASLSRTTYQRVGSTHDVTEAGQPDCWYLDTSGSKWMQTNAIDFSATDEMTVIAGVRKLSDAADGMLVELSPAASANTSSFYFTAPEITASQTYASLSRGSAGINANQKAAFSTGTGTAPETCVLSTTHDISSDLTTLRRNGTAATNATGDKGSGNFGNHALFIASRNGSSVFFNGHLFHLIIRGKTTEGSKLTGAEKLTARKTGITI